MLHDLPVQAMQLRWHREKAQELRDAADLEGA